MKRLKSRHSGLRFVVEDKSSPNTYLRLCHRCLFLNESSQNILKCSRCESVFNSASAVEVDKDLNLEMGSDEDPIQEAIADFESEKASGSDDRRSPNSEEAADGHDSDEDGTESRVRPISGLSVLW